MSPRNSNRKKPTMRSTDGIIVVIIVILIIVIIIIIIIVIIVIIVLIIIVIVINDLHPKILQRVSPVRSLCCVLVPLLSA